jgi:DNA-binding NarL/FixJ family response regulator
MHDAAGVHGQPADLRMRALSDGGHIVLVSFSLGRLMALTGAELEVARWAHAGHSNCIIARQRQTAIHTVARQMAAAIGKLGVGARLWLATIPELGAWSPRGLRFHPAGGSPLDSMRSRKGCEVEPQGAVRIWREIAAGHWSTVTGIDAGGLRHAVMNRESAKPIDWRALSPTHRGVLALIADGFPQKVIAMKLGMAPSTVSAALNATRRQLGFDSLSRLVRAYCAVRDLFDQPAGR